jgi:hypothetical protein
MNLKGLGLYSKLGADKSNSDAVDLESWVPDRKSTVVSCSWVGLGVDNKRIAES